jgi:hypothetical protein
MIAGGSSTHIAGARGETNARADVPVPSSVDPSTIVDAIADDRVLPVYPASASRKRSANSTPAIHARPRS